MVQSTSHSWWAGLAATIQPRYVACLLLRTSSVSTMRQAATILQTSDGLARQISPNHPPPIANREHRTLHPHKQLHRPEHPKSHPNHLVDSDKRSVLAHGAQVEND